MSEGSFPVGIDFQSVLRAISKQIYETPLAFIRENAQNAVDAVRIQAHRDQVAPNSSRYRIDIKVEGHKIVVRDNGIGMSKRDLETLFWTIGASGKRTQEALAAGCVGMFGIGGFANFGVCHTLEVISQRAGEQHGTLTRLAETDIRRAGTAIPSVTVGVSDAAAPRGTVVVGHLRAMPNTQEMRRYLHDFVRFVPTAIYFDGEKLSQDTFADIASREDLIELGDGQQEWQDGGMTISGTLFEDRGHTLLARIEGLTLGREPVNVVGYIRFENGPIDVFKRGFKLCATQIGTTIGVSGRLDCDRFAPTAGRDSLDAPTTSLLTRIALALEGVAVKVVLESPERIAQHTRIFRYVVQRGLVDRLGQVKVHLADGSDSSLSRIRLKAEQGGVRVFFGLAQKQALNQVMQARGHIVVLLSADGHRRTAERSYLQKYCEAQPFDGIIDCVEYYSDLSRFERIFLSELELNVSRSYEVKNFRLIAGKLTEDIPVFVKEHGSGQALDIFVDTKHQEIAKLEALGFTQLLYSLTATFCREYLGPSLKKWSPRFFGDGAINLDLIARRRSELWVLLKDDVGVVRKGGQRHVFTRSDVHVVNIGVNQAVAGKPHPRILNVVDRDRATGLAGFYIRLPDSAFRAYGDLLPECDSRGVVWAGNKILYVASDAVSSAFQYEIRLDEVVVAEINGVPRAEGALQLDRPLQEMYEGLYFPVPSALEPFLVPRDDAEIRLELHCDWMDTRTAKHWSPTESSASD